MSIFIPWFLPADPLILPGCPVPVWQIVSDNGLLPAGKAVAAERMAMRFMGVTVADSVTLLYGV